MSRPVKLALALGCLVVVVLVVAGLAAALARIPTVEEQVARSAAAMQVSLREPAGDTTWPLNSSIPVYALVTGGEAITSAELWANGGLVGMGALGPGAASGHAPVDWSWSPAATGDYALVVRAQDALGRTGVSQPVLIHVGEPAGAILVYAVQPGDTFDSISQAHGLTPEQIEQANPSASGGQAPLPGSFLQIHLPPLVFEDIQAPVTPEPPKEPGVIQVSTTLGKLGFWLADALGSDDQAPAAPALTASVEACDVLLTFTDSSESESGFLVYRATDAQPALALISTLPPNNGGVPLAFKDPAQSGLTTYVVAVFNTAGEAASNPATVKVSDPSCAPAEPPPPAEGEDQVSPPPSTNPDLAAPSISAARAPKCTVMLSIVDQSGNEDGFHVYVKSDGETTFSNEGKYWDWSKPHDGPDPIALDLEDQHGHVSYYVSSYNAGGESPSNVADVYLYDDECAAGRSAWDKQALQDGFLDLKPGVTLAYFYSRAAAAHSEDWTPWSRTPADPAAFLPVSGEPFDLFGSLEQAYGTSLADPQYGYFSVEVELWGWIGPDLVPLGTLKWNLVPNLLLGCVFEAGCMYNPNYAGLSTELTIPVETKVRRRQFYWLHDASAGPGIWQLSRQPFPAGYDLNPPGLLASGAAGWGTWIDFTGVENACEPLDLICLMGHFLKVPGGDPPSRRLTPADFAQGGDFYLRVLPASPDPQGKVRITNTVVVHIAPFPYQLDLPSLGDYYTVEIVELQQPKLVIPADWGCVILKQDWTVTLFGETKVLRRKGERVCPDPIPPKPDCDVWCQAEKIGEGVVDGYDWVVKQIEKAKDLAVGFVADVVNEISPGLCSDKCKSVMKAGLNAGITALTGLPPSLPNLKDVANKGLDYAVDYAASQAGADCDADCKKYIRTALGPLVDQILPSGSGPSVPGCGDAALAAQYGKLPMCFTNDMAEPAPNSHYEPAVVLVKVRRGTAATIDVDPNEWNYLRLDVGGFNSNTTYASKWFDVCRYGVSDQPKSTYTDAGGYLELNYQPNPESPMRTDEMYAAQAVPLPWLEPGEEVTIPIVLTPQTYRVYSGEARSRCPSVDDWPYLFYAGVTRITAAPMCATDLDNTIPTLMGCGTGDHKEFDNPVAPETYVAPPQAVPAE
jgi:LysM repeat protein